MKTLRPWLLGFCGAVPLTTGPGGENVGGGARGRPAATDQEVSDAYI